jgi:hypothetical protein
VAHLLQGRRKLAADTAAPNDDDVHVGLPPLPERGRIVVVEESPAPVRGPAASLASFVGKRWGFAGFWLGEG